GGISSGTGRRNSCSPHKNRTQLAGPRGHEPVGHASWVRFLWGLHELRRPVPEEIPPPSKRLDDPRVTRGRRTSVEFRNTGPHAESRRWVLTPGPERTSLRPLI